MRQLLFILFISIAFNFTLNEKLSYDAKFKNIPAGTAIMEIKNYLEDSTKFEIIYSLKTTKFIDVFYKLREYTSMITNIKDFTLEFINKQSHQGKYKKEHQATFEYNNNRVIYNDKEYLINDKVYYPIGVIYYLRTQNLSENQKYTFDVYSSGKIKKIEMRYVGDEVVTINKEQYDCFIFALYSPDEKTVLKNNGELKVWFTKDSTHLPVIIEQQAKSGQIVLKYNNKNLNQ